MRISTLFFALFLSQAFLANARAEQILYCSGAYGLPNLSFAREDLFDRFILNGAKITKHGQYKWPDFKDPIVVRVPKNYCKFTDKTRFLLKCDGGSGEALRFGKGGELAGQWSSVRSIYHEITEPDGRKSTYVELELSFYPKLEGKKDGEKPFLAISVEVETKCKWGSE